MKVVVTGGNGFVGSHIVDVLLEKGYTVHCLVRQTSDLRWLEDKPVTLVEGSIYDSNSLQTAFKDAEYIIHVAGLTAARNEEEFMKGNKNGTENVLRAALLYQSTIKKFVHISSMAAVGPATSLQQPLDESTPFHPITPYGVSKHAAEVVVHTAMSKLPITVVRPPAVYGERDSAILSFFQTVNKHLAPLIGFTDKWVSLIHVRDLAIGTVQAMESDNTTGKTYFISSEEFYNWNQISQLTAKVLGKKCITLKIPHGIVMSLAYISEFFGRFSSKPPVFNYEKGKDIIQEYWICSVGNAKNDFNYRQTISLEQGIRQTTDWYKANKWL
ncbi:MAG: NAD-dependent epimerase/dehydratase family protein [Candidatus Kapaibacterium sp.]